jgi:lysophospholipase L1-like esterase
MFRGGNAMEHIILVGDGTLDNRKISSPDPDVISHLRVLIPNDWKATLCATEGSTLALMPAQIHRIPNDASYIIASIGANDVLRFRLILSNSSQSGLVVLSMLAKLVKEFTQNYREIMLSLKALKRPICCCTIYNGNLNKEEIVAAKAAIAIFNDGIYSVANELQVSVLELRRICTEAADFENQKDLSGLGGQKFAKAILAKVQEHVAHKEIEKKAL